MIEVIVQNYNKTKGPRKKVDKTRFEVHVLRMVKYLSTLIWVLRKVSLDPRLLSETQNEVWKFVLVLIKSYTNSALDTLIQQIGKIGFSKKNYTINEYASHGNVKLPNFHFLL